MPHSKPELDLASGFRRGGGGGKQQSGKNEKLPHDNKDYCECSECVCLSVTLFPYLDMPLATMTSF